MQKVLTIDGFSGVGKGTVARIIASDLGWDILDSGAIYRALALLAHQQKISTNDEQALVGLASQLNLSFMAESGKELLSVYLDEQEVSAQLRTQDCANLASQIAKIGAVRVALLTRQRHFATPKGLVADGRDMGSIVFPDAAYKVFLTANIQQRVERRLKQLQSTENFSKIANLLDNRNRQNNSSAGKQERRFVAIKAEIVARDRRDTNRKHSPLKPADDAVVIDTSDLSVSAVVQKIKQLVVPNL